MASANPRPPISRVLAKLAVFLAAALFGVTAWAAIHFMHHGTAMEKGVLIILATFIATAGMVWGAIIPGLTVKAFPTNGMYVVAVLLTYVGLIVLALIHVEVVFPFLGFALSNVIGLVKLHEVAFLAVAALTVVSAAGVAFSRNIIYSAFSLLFTLLGVGGLYIFLAAPFLAVTQLLVYVGGILVLILFAIMLTGGIGDDPKITNLSVGLPAGAGLGAAVAGMLIFVGLAGPWKTMASPSWEDQTLAIGDGFLTEYLLPFEIASVVLLAALVGSVIIARKDVDYGSKETP